MPESRRTDLDEGVPRTVNVRAPHLHDALRGFCLGAFALLGRELERGAELPFAFEEHASRGRPALYEYRPLVRDFVEERAGPLSRLEDAHLARDELLRIPGAAIYARAQAAAPADDPIVGGVLVPLLVRAAEACGGFDWDDAAFGRAYLELEGSLFADRRAYAAVAPLVGVSVSAAVGLAHGLRLRRAQTGEFGAHWPEASRLLPSGFGREPDRLCVLELEGTLPGGEADPPDAPGDLADAVTALRLATAGAVAAGPVLFERIDWRPLGVRPVVPIAATPPAGEAVRLDAARGRLASDLLARLCLADDDPELGEALDRWELSLFQADPFRSEQLRESLAALLGGSDGLPTAALRAALLLGDEKVERSELRVQLRRLAGGEDAGPEAADAVRRALVETVAHGDRHRLTEALDDALLGLRPRPAGYFARLAAA